ncbi:S8 family serine peptidase [Lentzea aerocolonigenes]|uniref:S8 family serine peptidase n=1 Tax=Lentzea aerocolonigenes TaxID=68170 RepID=UPI0004C454A5|nr:S8 family serine peptidase [Lentzea aerocolonigenes]MCP2246407.1 PA domain-containing protein [Lentzea aerocolonigenes]
MTLRNRVRLALLVTVVPLTLVTGGIDASGAPVRPNLQADQLTVADRVSADKSPTSRLAKTDQSLLGRTDSTLVPVLIKLDYDSMATYAGGVKGLAPTSPSVTGKKLDARTADQQRYHGYAAGQEKAFTAELKKKAPSAITGLSLRVVYGGISARVPANSVKDILAIPNVVAVQEDSINKILTDSSSEFIGAPTVYNQLGTTANAGEGIIYGNLDTGVWPEHPSFADLGNLRAPPGPARECNFGDNPLTPASDPFACQDKLIGGAHFADTYDALQGDDPFAGTARDSNGHGTHTASTSAGNIVEDVTIRGRDFATIHGIAPGAWVMEYKVCGPAGCFGSDTTAAVGQAILDGVQVINYSISGGEDPFTDPTELAFLDAYAAGVFVSASAGNAGPGAGTAGHLSPWVTTVAASTQSREFFSTLTVTGSNGDTFTADGASITPGAGPLPIVLASDAPYSDALCTTPAPAGLFTGKIVACQRGPGRVLKGFNVSQGGAAGMVLYNPTLAEALTDTHWLPAVHLPDGGPFLAFMTGHSGETATFTAGSPRTGTNGDVMAAFSSRGPGGHFLKPDVTAPGVQILAGDTPVVESTSSGPGGEYFQAIAGTSMSSPHNAGAAVLLRALNPSWTPGQVKSGLMTTAVQDLRKEDLTTPAGPFDYGSGRIDLTDAGTPGLTFDETAANMALLGNDPNNAVHLNIPSVNANVMPGRLTTIRTAKNVTGARQRYTAQTTAPAGATISVQPKTFTLEPGQSAQLAITIESHAAPAQHFGEVRLVPNRAGLPTLHLPVAFVTGQTQVTLASECAPTAIPVNGTSTCQVTATNTSFDDTTVSLTTKLSNQLKVESASGATVVNKRTVSKPDVPLAGAAAGVPSVDPGALFGYIPLDAFGITPTPIGDEEIINFNVPSFVYNGVTYSRIGVDSNGYLVAGGGTAEDNNCCSLPPGPSPARPNNVLAPFWTDLDGTGAQGVYATVLTDGTNSWLVFEYRVNVFGTASGRVFQVWIGIDGTQDITYAYDPANLPSNPGQPFLVGAENQFGNGDMAATLPVADQRVTSTAPTPGASVTYTVTVKGTERGTGTVTTEMTGPDLPGTAIVRNEIRIG